MSLFGAKPTKLSFERVAETEIPVLYRVARRLTRNDTEAEDLVGQTLLSAARAWDSFDGRFARSWLLRILKNAHTATVRTKINQPERAVIEDEEYGDEDPWGDIDWRLIGSEILRVLDRLPEEFRLAVTLCDVEELSYQEAAEVLEVPIGTVRSRLFRGRRMIRCKLPALAKELSS